MAYWDNIGSAKVSAKGNYFPYENQRYLVEITAIKHDPTAYNGECLIFTFEVIESTSPSVAIGESKDWVLKLAGDPQKVRLAYGNIKNVVCSAMGWNSEDPSIERVVNEVAERMSHADNPLMGARIELTTIATLTKNKQPFTAHNFSIANVPHPTIEQIRQRRANGAPPPAAPPPMAPWQAPGFPANWHNATQYWNGSTWINK